MARGMHLYRGCHPEEGIEGTMNRIVLSAVMALGVLGACGGSSGSSSGSACSTEGAVECGGAAAKSSTGSWSGTALLQTCTGGEWVTTTNCATGGGACIDVGMPTMCMY